MQADRADQADQAHIARRARRPAGAPTGPRGWRPPAGCVTFDISHRVGPRGWSAQRVPALNTRATEDPDMAPTLRRGAVVSATAAVTLAVAGLSPALAQAAGPSPRTDARRRAGLDHPRRSGRPDPGRAAAAPHRRPRPAGPRRCRVPRCRRLRPRERAVRRLRHAAALAGPVRPPRLRRGRRDGVAAGGRLHRRRHPGQPPQHQLQRHHRPGREGLRHRPADLPQVGVHRHRHASSVLGPPRPSPAPSSGISGLDTSALRKPDHTGAPTPPQPARASATTRPRPARPRPPTRSHRPGRSSATRPPARPTTARRPPPRCRRSSPTR